MLTFSPHKKHYKHDALLKSYTWSKDKKKRRLHRKDENIEDILHSNFATKNHQSQVHPRSTNDMRFACCTQSFADNTFAFCTPQSVKH
jgi:hypothetical protein